MDERTVPTVKEHVEDVSPGNYVCVIKNRGRVVAVSKLLIADAEKALQTCEETMDQPGVQPVAVLLYNLIKQVKAGRSATNIGILLDYHP
jgi:hypothetical protein